MICLVLSQPPCFFGHRLSGPLFGEELPCGRRQSRPSRRLVNTRALPCNRLAAKGGHSRCRSAQVQRFPWIQLGYFAVAPFPCTKQAGIQQYLLWPAQVSIPFVKTHCGGSIRILCTMQARRPCPKQRGMILRRVPYPGSSGHACYCVEGCTSATPDVCLVTYSSLQPLSPLMQQSLGRSSGDLMPRTPATGLPNLTDWDDYFRRRVGQFLLTGISYSHQRTEWLHRSMAEHVGPLQEEFTPDLNRASRCNRRYPDGPSAIAKS